MLTVEEREELEKAKEDGFVWVAKDVACKVCGEYLVYVFKSKPEKEVVGGYWEDDNESEKRTRCRCNMLSFKDEEPTLINDLLKVQETEYIYSATLKENVMLEKIPETKAEMHERICKGLRQTYIEKNHDYGDSFAILRQEYDNAILVRLFDKYNRLKTLKMGAGQQVNDESIRDTLIDLANYAILELIEMELEEKENESK